MRICKTRRFCDTSCIYPGKKVFSCKWSVRVDALEQQQVVEDKVLDTNVMN